MGRLLCPAWVAVANKDGTHDDDDHDDHDDHDHDEWDDTASIKVVPKRIDKKIFFLEKEL